MFLAISEENCMEGLENADSSTPSTSSTSSTSDYKEYNANDPNNALILAQQNAGNISYLKERLSELMGLQKQVNDISQNVNALNEQVAGLVQQQATYAQSIAGNKPVEISGTTPE